MGNAMVDLGFGVHEGSEVLLDTKWVNFDEALPCRPLRKDPANMWGSEECPFELAPRWLTPPNEISFALTSASSVRCLHGSALYKMRQTVKLFATVKVTPKPC